MDGAGRKTLGEEGRACKLRKDQKGRLRRGLPCSPKPSSSSAPSCCISKFTRGRKGTVSKPPPGLKRDLGGGGGGCAHLLLAVLVRHLQRKLPRSHCSHGALPQPQRIHHGDVPNLLPLQPVGLGRGIFRNPRHDGGRKDSGHRDRKRHENGEDAAPSTHCVSHCRRHD